ncbi:hypothetical protein CEE88_11610 [Lactobacillus crispatus]|nr:hypothetical protein [Lactobacillus crispatus]TDM71670.1 hypothetical protein CEF00_04255 [Lactobacillus crispatus]TDM74391.1 hypothetical protein CEE98_13250 [Lactobacillus crispatus]TDM93727.1 hypothetical protein CEE92_04175 [Lactobacillus crispatus]TDM96457.1 hypothetical protein CEE88_11610 [Lactobacillus crispatus]
MLTKNNNIQNNFQNGGGTAPSYLNCKIYILGLSELLIGLVKSVYILNTLFCAAINLEREAA